MGWLPPKRCAEGVSQNEQETNLRDTKLPGLHLSAAKGNCVAHNTGKGVCRVSVNLQAGENAGLSGNACLILHGFAGGVNDVRPLAESFSVRRWNVECPKLPGHTGLNKDLVTASYRDWLGCANRVFLGLRGPAQNRTNAGSSAVELATNQDCPQGCRLTHTKQRPATGVERRLVAIVGFSMGGLLAVHVAAKNKPDALILLNTPVSCGNVKEVISNVVRDLKTGRRTHIRRYARRLMNHPPVNALHSFRTLLKTTIPLFPEVTCPVFIGQSMRDDAVHPKSADFILEHVSSATKVFRRYPDSGHVICHEPDAPRLLEDVWKFLHVL